MTRTASWALAIVTALGLATAHATAASAAPPVRESGSFVDTFDDDFILELCGITTRTTLTQSWSSTVYSDGSEIVHVVRTFVPEDPRVPVEKGAGTTFIAPDGTRRVVGKPLQLFDPDGGIRLLATGWVEVDPNGTISEARGAHSPLPEGDLSEYYCPS